MKTTSKILLSSLFLVALSQVSAPAQIIYSDTFTDAAGTALDGSAPTIDTGGNGGTAGATWTASTTYTENGLGSAVFTSPGYGGAAGSGYLPFIPQLGQIYVLSADLNYTAGDGGWQMFGFASSGTVLTGAADNFSNFNSWVLDSGSASQTFAGPGNTNSEGSVGGNGVFTITLNTQAAAWTATFQGPSGASSTYTYATNPTIKAVEISNQYNAANVGTSGGVSALSLTSLAPEPSISTLFALGFGSLALILINRRRRKA